jgi:hypothetical protein
MLQSDLYVSEQTMHKRLHQRRQDQEVRNLQKRAAALHPTWLTRQACRLLCGTGGLLVALGKRLERHDLGQPVPLEDAGATR